jgi:hypothetical protein
MENREGAPDQAASYVEFRRQIAFFCAEPFVAVDRHDGIGGLNSQRERPKSKSRDFCSRCRWNWLVARR